MLWIGRALPPYAARRCDPSALARLSSLRGSDAIRCWAVTARSDPGHVLSLSRQSRNQTGNTITSEAASTRPTMAEAALTDRYAANLHGVLSCYDRIIITGTLPGAGYAGGMTSFLFSRGIRSFDYPRFAEPLHSRKTDSCPSVAPCAMTRPPSGASSVFTSAAVESPPISTRDQSLRSRPGPRNGLSGRGGPISRSGTWVPRLDTRVLLIVRRTRRWTRRSPWAVLDAESSPSAKHSTRRSSAISPPCQSPQSPSTAIRFANRPASAASAWTRRG
jgi:hypothetical protein